jgi:hypothetical protein
MNPQRSGRQPGAAHAVVAAAANKAARPDPMLPIYRSNSACERRLFGALPGRAAAHNPSYTRL